MRLPQGSWFPWSREFRWDRWPWQGSTRHERESLRDQRELAALVEAAASTIGPVVREAGFRFRPDASGVNRLNGVREISLLYEADSGEVGGRPESLDDECDPCADLWIHWSPETQRLDLTLAGTLPALPARQVAQSDLRSALQSHADLLAEHLEPYG